MSASHTSKHSRRPRIIVLEHSQTFSEILKGCITDWFRDPDVVSFENGDEAWDEMKRQEPDLLMMDQVHPGMNGEELVWWLATREVSFPVLSLSKAMSVNDELAQSIKLVSQPTPFSRHTLWQALNKLVGPCDFPEAGPERNAPLRTSVSRRRKKPRRRS